MQDVVKSLLNDLRHHSVERWDGTWRSGPDAWQELINAHDAVAQASVACADALPSGEWLRFVRSLPAERLAPGASLDSTPLLIRDLVTCLTAQSRTPVSSGGAVQFGGARWKQHDDRIVTQLEGLLAAARVVKWMQSACWWIGKGAAVRLPGKGGRHPYDVDVRPAVRRRVEDFDAGPGHGLLGALGSTAE